MLVKKAVTGILLGAIAGAIQVWFFKRDLMHLWASIASGIVYMTAWVSCTDWLKLAGGKILLGAVAGARKPSCGGPLPVLLRTHLFGRSWGLLRGSLCVVRITESALSL